MTAVSRRAVLAAAAAGLAGAAHAQPAGNPAVAPPELKALSAGSALYGLRPAAAEFARNTGIPVAVATDHGHNIRKHTLAGTADANVIVVPTEWAEEIVKAGKADKGP